MPKIQDFTPTRKRFIPTPEEYLKMYKLLLRMTLFGRELDARKDEFIPKVFTGLGQEAIAVGAVSASENYDWFAMDHRATLALLGLGFSEEELICQQGAFAESLYHGYNFGIHIGDMKRRVIRFISDMGANVAVGTGVIDAVYYWRDLIYKKDQDKHPVLFAFFGDGAMSHANLHSAFKMATTRHLPIVFILNNNGLAIRTGVEYQSPLISLAPTAAGYGMPAETINPNYDVFTNRLAVKRAADYCRGDKNGPYFLEFKAECRDSGHNAYETAEMSGYVPRELRLEEHGRNPLAHCALSLKIMRLLDDEKEKELTEKTEARIKEAFETKKNFTAPSKLRPVFKETVFTPVAPGDAFAETKRELTYGAAINEALRQAMEMYPNLRVFGEDVESGGVHGITKNLAKLFGKERIFHMPLDENGIMAFAIGNALTGIIACPEMQFFPFIECTALLTRYAATNFAITGENVSLVARAPCGGGFSSNEEHEKMIEASLAHAGGLKVVFPATPFAAKGLLMSAFADGNPVIFLEQISHYGKKGAVPEEPYQIPFGEAEVRMEGRDISLITYGALMVERTLKAAEILRSMRISAEVIDLQTIVPMDKKAILRSVAKTGNALIIHEAKTAFGAGAEISRIIGEETLDIKRFSGPQLAVPIYVKVLGAKDGPVAARPELEKLRMPQIDDIVEAAKGVLK